MKRRLAAVLSRHAFSVIAYGESQKGFEVTQVASMPGPFPDIDDSVRRLAASIREQVRGDAELSILVHGMASNYEKLALPTAAPALLEMVVQREMLRLSGIAGGNVAYMMNDGPLAAGSKQEVWAGIISADMRDLLIGRLAEIGVTVRHIAVLPSVLASLYAGLGSGASEAAVMLCLPEGPVSGFFQAGKLRLILESPLGDAEESSYAAVCTEQHGRGSLFLRQQFRGAAAQTVLLAADPHVWNEVAADLRAVHGVQVLPLGDTREPLSSLLALGAAMSAKSHPSMNLARGARGGRVRDPARWISRAAGWSKGAVILAVLFALLQLGRLTRTESMLKERDETAWQYYRQLTTMGSTARARAAERRNIEGLQAVLLRNGSLQTVLSALAAATPRSIQLDSVEIVRRGASWDAIVLGRALTETNAEGVRQLSQFYRNLGSQPPIQNATVEDFGYLTGD